MYLKGGCVITPLKKKNDTNTHILPDVIQCPLHLPIKKQNKALENLIKK